MTRFSPDAFLIHILILSEGNQRRTGGPRAGRTETDDRDPDSDVCRTTNPAMLGEATVNLDVSKPAKLATVNGAEKGQPAAVERNSTLEGPSLAGAWQ
jgi:hypothetical protein